MKLEVFATAAILGLARADWSADLSKAAAAAETLSSSVNNWSAGNGLIAALGIQVYYPTLSNAVVSLANDVKGVSDAEIDVNNVNSFVSSVANLLNALTAKAGDFSSVGASQIVGNDIKGLTSPSTQVVNGLISALQNDCGKFNQLTPALNTLSAGLGSAAAAYSVAAPSFPQAKCGN